MDLSWGSAGLGAPGADPLNLLEPFDLLDDRTLQCFGAAPSALGAAASLAVAQGSEAGPSTSKRPREDTADCFGSWGLGGEAEGEAGGDGGDDSGGDDEGGDKKARRLGKKGKPMSQQALVKANREKARRERLNDCFEELAKLCDPGGKVVKSDRVSIVADAIRVLSQLRVENNQLRQLNKFLEERVSTYERQRAQAMYQQVMMQQMQQQQAQHAVHAAAPGEIQPALPTLPAVPSAATLAAMATAPPPLADAGPSAATPVATAAAAPEAAEAAATAAAAAQQQQQQQQQPQPGAVMPAQAVALSAQGVQQAGQATVALVTLPSGGLGAQLVGIKQEQLAGLGLGQQAMLLPVGLPSALPPGAPPVGWLPAASLDVSQDQKLRPPAA